MEIFIEKAPCAVKILFSELQRILEGQPRRPGNQQGLGLQSVFLGLPADADDNRFILRILDVRDVAAFEEVLVAGGVVLHPPEGSGDDLVNLDVLAQGDAGRTEQRRDVRRDLGAIELEPVSIFPIDGGSLVLVRSVQEDGSEGYLRGQLLDFVCTGGVDLEGGSNFGVDPEVLEEFKVGGQGHDPPELGQLDFGNIVPEVNRQAEVVKFAHRHGIIGGGIPNHHARGRTYRLWSQGCQGR